MYQPAKKQRDELIKKMANEGAGSPEIKKAIMEKYKQSLSRARISQIVNGGENGKVSN